MNKTRLWRGITALLSVFLSVAIFMSAVLFQWAGQVNAFLNVEVPKAEVSGDTVYYDIGYSLDGTGLAQMLSDSDKHDIQTMEEGAVLIKNDQAALPLSAEERSVTLFGRAVADPLFAGNSGSPSIVEQRVVTLYSALQSKGFRINDTLFDAYDASSTKRIKGSFNSATGTDDTSIGEEYIEFYTDELRASWENDYNDVAIVMFARGAGEGNDLSVNDVDGVSQLSLHPQEADLLKMIKESGKFSKVILLINSPYAMELDWVKDEQYGVDAALWIGGTGLKGFEGVANILVGDADPTGRFVDTYATNQLSSAAAQNMGSYTFTNMDRSYLIQAEGIYSGYKYYETRYQDEVLGINNATSTAGTFASVDGWSYAEEMAYPFGFGMSYTDFTQELQSVEWNRETHTVTAVVKVTNNGAENYEGTSKSVVQLYVQLPYENTMAEKSAIQLIGFGKTKALLEGESDLVTITVDDYLFTTYDMYATNGADPTKTGCYVFDAGDYYFTIGDNCHDALNNILAKRGVMGLVDEDGNSVSGNAEKVVTINLASLDNTTYAVSRYTGNVVSNLFEDVDINYYYDNDVVTYLTRADWNTFPKSYEGLSATQEMVDKYNDKTWEVPDDAPSYDSFEIGVDKGIKFIDLKDADWDDEIWDDFIDQLSLSQLCNIVGEDFGQPAIKTVGKPQNKNTDGPAGPFGAYIYGTKEGTTMHVNEVVAASTWNPEILFDRGKLMACDCVFSGVTQIWGPGANLHRTPFSGRNFEYYSEDSVLTYLCGAYQTQAMQQYGANAGIKHFAGNDQETNRVNIHNFMTEQKLRQDPLKGFEGAYTAEGGALASMMSFTAFGMHSDLYSDSTLLTDVVRNEWGWKGVNITDNLKTDSSVSAVEALVAGTDTFNAANHKGKDILSYLAENQDGYVLQCLRQANKRFFYAMSRSNLVNGISVDTEVEDFIPWWQPTLYVICGVVGILTIASCGMYVSSRIKQRREQSLQ